MSACSLTLYCTPVPKNWTGYTGFKDNQFIPLRDFSRRSQEQTQLFIETFSDGLAQVSWHYACVTTPSAAHATPDELQWLGKIHRTGNIANFLPLMIAARKRRAEQSLQNADYIELLKALEHYAYRVFLFEGRRSNAGISRFNNWGHDVFHGTGNIDPIIAAVYGMARYYAPDNSFEVWSETPDNWYYHRSLLKYTLYEYEIHLLEVEGKGNAAQLSWQDLKDSTIEHILPQTPGENSYWTEQWTQEERGIFLDDIGNLVLTHNNSNYLNFDFQRKKGNAGLGHCYANSDIRQERKLAQHSDWSAKECAERRSVLVNWINTRWGTPAFQYIQPLDIVEEADEDGIEQISEIN